MTTINERLRLVRKTMNLTTTKLGELIGYGQSTVSMIENARHPYDNPDKIANSYIRLFSLAFNINETWLHKGEGGMFNVTPRGLPSEAIAAQLFDLVDKTPLEELRKIVKDFVGSLVDASLKTTDQKRKIIDKEA